MTITAQAGATINRRLAAVAFADVAGFSKLMELNDVQTMHKWKALRTELLEPKIIEHRGHLLRVIGDALFIEFQSAVDAVRWSHDVQRAIALARRDDEAALMIRIGINVEDVIVDEDDIHGDGVNIAARIQQLANPGEIIVTATVRDYIWNKLGMELTDLGTRELKNISRPVHIFRIEQEQAEPGQRQAAQPYLTWNNRPSIAVLPFRNLGGDPAEGYFGEGITEDIIGALSRSRSLLVIARHSTLRYRDHRVDVRQISSELGVRYILDGSVRRQSRRLRISVDLLDTGDNRTLWADKFDGEVDDLFDFQDRIAASIVATIEPRVYEAEVRRVHSKPTESLDAYDCVLRAFALLYTFKNADFQRAGEYIIRATELDPEYAQAHAYKAWWYNLAAGEGRSGDFEKAAQDAVNSAQRAVDLDPNDALVLAVAGHIQAFLHKRPEVSVDLFERALQLNPNSAFAWGISGSTYCFLGKPEEALERLRNAWRLSPFDPLNFWFWTVAGIAEFVAGRYDQAVAWLRKSQRTNPRFRATLRTLAASLALAGREREAREVGAELLAVEPGFRVSFFASWYPLRGPGDIDRLAEGLRAAGLPH